MDKGKRILMGRILKAHGLKGEVKVKSFTADPRALGAYGPLVTGEGRLLELDALRGPDDALIARFKGVRDRNAAEAIEGLDLFVPRAALPEPEPGVYYQGDLIGLHALSETGAFVGKVAALYNFGAGDIIEIERAGAAPLLLPFNDDFVPEVDLEGGFVRVAPGAEDADEKDGEAGR